MINEFDTQRQALEALNEELGLDLEFEAEAPAGASGRNLRGLVHIKKPFELSFTFEVKLWYHQPASLIAQFTKQLSDDVVLATDYISEQKGKALRQHGVEFFDTAGNIYLNRPGLHVWVIGKKFPYWEGPGTINSRAAFERSGLKVTFALITQPQLILSPYRTIAEVSGVALGTVKRVLDSLEQSKNLASAQKQRQLQIDKAFLNDWAQAYINKLLPKLSLGEFVSEDTISPEGLDYFSGAACLGSEVAADYFTGVLKPKTKTLYVEKEVQPELMAKYRLKRTSPFNTSVDHELVQIVTKFWKGNEKPYMYAHPLVVYADLLATNNPRNTEAAEVLYEKHLKTLCR